MHWLLLPDPSAPCKALRFGSKELSRSCEDLVVPKDQAPGLWPQFGPWWPQLCRARRFGGPHPGVRVGKEPISGGEWPRGTQTALEKALELWVFSRRNGRDDPCSCHLSPVVALTSTALTGSSPFPPPLCPAGPHSGALPARFQQQPLVHHVVHAVLAGPAAAAQRHPAVPPAPVPAVPAPAEAVQPARYCRPRVPACPGGGTRGLGCPRDEDPFHLIPFLDLHRDGEKVEVEMRRKDEFGISQVGSNLLLGEGSEPKA